MKQHSGEEKPRKDPVSLLGEVFDRLGQGLIHLDAGFCITYANPAAAGILKNQKAELAGHALQDAIPGSLGRKLSETLTVALNNNADLNLEGYYPVQGGRRIRFNCLPSEEGILLVFQDITAEKQKPDALQRHDALPENADQPETQHLSQGARDDHEHLSDEEAFWHTRDMLHAVLDNAPAGLAVTDRSGKMILTNAALKEILGGPVTGTAYGPRGGYMLLTLDGLPINADDLPLPRALANGDITRGEELLVKRDDGSEAVVLASATPLRNDAGEISGAITALQDITEFKITEKTLQALRDNRERLRLAQQAGHVGILEWDMTAGRSILSDEMRAIYGVSPDFGGTMEDWEKITPQEDIREVLDKIDEAVGRQGTEIESEYRVIRPDGEVRWLSSRGIIYYDDSGKPVRMTVVAIDITDLKNSQEALRRVNEDLEQKVAERTGSLEQTTRSLERQKELLQAIIDSIPVIVTVWRPYRRLMMVNKEFERLSGWSHEEATKMDIIAATFPDPAYRKEIIKLVTTAEPGWGEFVMTTRSGKKLNITWAAVDLSDGSRVGIGINVTEQRKMENDMLRLAAAIDQAGEGIVLLDSKWVVEYVNPAFENISGFTREEMIGMGIDSLSRSVVGDFDAEVPLKTASGGEIWSGHIKVKKKNGEIIDNRLTVSPVRNKSGEIINYVSVVQDITQETKYQQMIIQSQKMEAIGTLAGGISHDLKNIFMPILINSESAMEDVGIDHPAYPLLEEILEAGRMGGDLVKQIMTFARPKPPKKEPVDVTSIVRETLSLLRAAIPTTIDIKRRFSSGSLEVLADPTQIKQVLMNLGSNAAHAMKEHGGHLQVTVSRVDLAIDEALKIAPDLAPGTYVEIDVSDTGEGMDEETIQHIFDPFFTTKQHGEGTGLGLAVAQEIAKGHKGAISVWSRRGKGSTFKVLLPGLEKGPADKTQQH